TSSAVAALASISDALGIPLSWVLDDHPETDIVLLPNDTRQYKIGNEHIGYSYELPANRSKFPHTDPTSVYVRPKHAKPRHEPYTQKQEGFIYILEGSIHL